MRDVMSNGRCVGVDVTFLKNCTALKAAACETAATEYPNCDVPISETTTSEKVTYNPTCLMHEAGGVDDGLCNNEYDAEELFTNELARLITNLDIRLNRYAYARLAANAQANVDPLVTDYGTINGTRVDINAANWTADLLTQLEINAGYNGLDNYIIVDGRNFVTQKALSEYRFANADDKDQSLQFRAWNGRMIMDNPRDAFAELARHSSFFVDMDMLAFVNRTHYTSSTPVLIDPSKNIYTFTVTSGRTGIKYDVDYQKVCKTGRNSLSYREYKHALDVKFVGDIIFAPVQCDNGTGILEFTRIP